MAILLSIEWLDRIFQADYPLIIQRWVFTLVTCLLSLSLPLLIKSINDVEGRFKKRGTGNVLLQTCAVKWYIAMIICTVFFIIIYLLQLPRVVDWGSTLNSLIDHSVEILVVLFSFGFLFSVLGVAFILVKFAKNTASTYELFRKNWNEYFTKEAAIDISNINEAKAKDAKLAKKYMLPQMTAVIATALQEKDREFFKVIVKDLQDGIKTYREKVRESNNNRHVLIELPFSLRQAIYEMSEMSFACNDIAIQQQVYTIVDTVFFDVPAMSNFDIPKHGLSESSLDTLWSILIEATNRKQTEYITLYWSSIFEYTKRMFHAPVIESPNHLPNQYQPYTLTDEDKFEAGLISYIHLLWQAYLYEKEDYDTLKVIVEYYNGVGDAIELNYFDLDNALLQYTNALLSNNQIAQEKNLQTTDNIVRNFSYYTAMSTSAVQKQKQVLAKYISYIVHYLYNCWDEVPLCTPNIIQLLDREKQLLVTALRSQEPVPSLQIDSVSVKKCMTDDEIDFFISTLRQRNDQQQRDFVRVAKIRNKQTQMLFRFVKSTLSLRLTTPHHVWINKEDFAEPDVTIYPEVVKITYRIPKETMLYGELTAITENVYRISRNYENEINVNVARSFYAKHAKRSINTVLPQDLIPILENKEERERAIFFYSNENDLNTLVEWLQYHYEPQTMFISSLNRERQVSIKSVRLREDELKTRKLNNQLWIIPEDEQPIVRFKAIEGEEEWKSIHEYAKKLKAIEDPLERKFEETHHYVRISNAEENQVKPVTEISIKSSIDVIGRKQINQQVYRVNL